MPYAIHHRPRESWDGNAYLGVALGGLGALVLAGLLAPLRDHVPNANMALALVIPVLLGAIVGGRVAGVVSAIVAALVFDFVFTKPYLSLRISSKDDVATFVVFAIVALVAAEIAIRARRGGAAARDARADLERMYRVAALSAAGADVDDVVSSVRAELIGLFDLVDCVYESEAGDSGRPRLGERGALQDGPLLLDGEFLLPTGGVEVPVKGRGRSYGRLLLYAGDATRAPLQKRMVAVGIADELGTTLAARQRAS